MWDNLHVLYIYSSGLKQFQGILLVERNESRKVANKRIEILVINNFVIGNERNWFKFVAVVNWANVVIIFPPHLVARFISSQRWRTFGYGSKGYINVAFSFHFVVGGNVNFILQLEFVPEVNVIVSLPFFPGVTFVMFINKLFPLSIMILGYIYVYYYSSIITYCDTRSSNPNA